MKNKFLPFLSLFSSTSTLICCALPALLISLGLGATLASINTQTNFLVDLAKYKTLLFTIAALLLLVNGLLLYRNKTKSCPINKQLAKACQETRSWSKIIFWISVIIYAIGFFFAYLAQHIFY